MLCSKTQWVRPGRRLALLTLVSLLCIDNHLVFTGCKIDFKLSYTDPVELSFLSSNLPIGNLALCYTGGGVTAKVKTNLNA